MDSTEKPLSSSQFNGREYARYDVTVMAEVRTSGGIKTMVRVLNLSRAGFQMECLPFIPRERPIFFALPGFMPLECSIAWHSDCHYGCSFLSPLHEAIFDHIVEKYPVIIRQSWGSIGR